MEFQAEQKVLKAFKPNKLNSDGTIEERELRELLKELDGSFTPREISTIVKAANFNEDGKVLYEEFVCWMFGMAGAGLQAIGFEALLDKLISVEGDKQAQDDLSQQLQSQGTCMIVTVIVDEPDSLRMLAILKRIRTLFARKIWDDEVRLVKAEKNRFFVFTLTPGKALRAAFSLQLLVDQLSSWIGDVCPEMESLASPVSLKVGIHDGGVLLIEGDCFGDPVDVALKLGEDLANPGEILLSASSALNDNDEDMKALLATSQLERKQTDISGLTLDYFLAEAQNFESIAVPVSGPSSSDLEAYLGENGEDAAIETRDLVILTTNMSGFARLTQKHGILHFLRLLLKTRSILSPAVAKCGGQEIKYEGDNIIATFPDADAAVSCIKSCVEQIARYNEARQEDKKGKDKKEKKKKCKEKDISTSESETSDEESDKEDKKDKKSKKDKADKKDKKNKSSPDKKDKDDKKDKCDKKDFQIHIGYALDVGQVTTSGHDIVGAAVDCSVLLAEDLAEVGEVLITARVRSAGWPSTQMETELSEERTMKDSGEEYYTLSFL